MEKKRMTIDVDLKTYKRIQRLAVDEDTTPKELVEEIVEERFARKLKPPGDNS